eukprot:5217928-Amphidinium_carterae.1
MDVQQYQLGEAEVMKWLMDSLSKVGPQRHRLLVKSATSHERWQYLVRSKNQFQDRVTHLCV